MRMKCFSPRLAKKTPWTSSFRILRYKFSPARYNKFEPRFEGFILAQLPPLPKPSEGLANLMWKFNELSDFGDNYSGSVNNAIRDEQFQKNAKAFRTFYSKSIRNAKYQRELSKALAELWKNEPSKPQWSLYALVYNLREKNIPFMQWLCASLNIGGGISDNYSQKFVTIKNTSCWLLKMYI
ncbi:uncharacterized protein CANTADRAFT_19262 [Suhomyces tanzawaensis NRRL Y-17324]|uniref:Alpha box domain-containing protein n=1 Tax=Suhomyces tanzawaensis NRRL Y-17324 TaxID=984487 RepID=A0A1E4SST5_9ASCO|nr:uncharacterized protein CANTADRAFT_19262 [Suhomyces tanzawaensis NRRL Y-17324]ODV82487.1 hypothetical protein CANTADRAFT_19262 [Suhomyces tanzawaensis NRRL Y-17324]